MRFLNILYKTVLALLMVFCAGIFVFGLFATVVFRQYQENDYPDLVRLDPVRTLVVFIIAALIILLLTALSGKLQSRFAQKSSTLPWGLILLLTFITCFCAFMILVIHGLPTNDARILYELTQDFMKGDYSSIKSGYLAYCPHQLSYVLLGEIITGFFGTGFWLPYQILNVISILITVLFLYLICVEFYSPQHGATPAGVHDLPGSGRGALGLHSAPAAFCLITPLCLMLFVYCTFIYNDIICLGPLFGAFYFLIRCTGGLTDTRTGSWGSDQKGHSALLFGILAAICSGISFFLKTNGAVALIAMECIIAAAFIRTMSARGKNGSQKAPGVIFPLILTGILTVLTAAGFGNGINLYYESRSGLKVNGGEPALSYIAMGLEETDGKYGWYNGMNVRFMTDASLDTGKASDAAAAWIGDRLSYFADHPKYAVKFFGIKLLSQWGDPTKVSLREQELTGRHQEGERPELAEVLTFGAGYYGLQCLMHVFHLLLYFFSFFGLLKEFASSGRKGSAAPDVSRWLLPVFIFGGILFHTFWEASGRYTLRYELALLPYAAAGISSLAAPLLSAFHSRRR